MITSGFWAEYGRASGGVVNTITRNGSNNYHGTAYWFFRNHTLNATDISSNGLNPQDWRHQASASIGGPIKKDKVFFFFQRRVAAAVLPDCLLKYSEFVVVYIAYNDQSQSLRGTGNCRPMRSSRAMHCRPRRATIGVSDSVRTHFGPGRRSTLSHGCTPVKDSSI